MEQDFKQEREKMVEEQLIPRGIASASVLDAMRSISRHLFVPENLVEQLNDGGRIIVPVGKTYEVQSLRLIIKTEGKIIDQELLLVRFVPMVK